MDYNNDDDDEDDDDFVDSISFLPLKITRMTMMC